MSLSGTCDVVAGKVFNTGANNGRGEWLTLEKLNNLGLPSVRVGAGQVTNRELDVSVSQSIAGNTAAIETEELARISADAALASQITTIQASVGDNAAAITAEATARAAADGVLASSITTLTANYNGTAASVEVLTEALVTGEEVKSIVAFNLTAGNKIAGWQLVNDGTTADAVWQVDKFIIDNGTTGQVPFEVDAGNVYIKSAFIRNLNASTITVGTFDGNRLADGAVSAAKIASGAVTGVKIADGVITASKIAAATITANEIAAGTITGAKIAAGTITGTLIAGTTITASNIAAGAIGVNQLAANSVTAAKIAAGTIEASNIKAGTIVADRIAAGTIDNVRMGSAAVGTVNIVVNAVSQMDVGINSYFNISSLGVYNAAAVQPTTTGSKVILTVSFAMTDGSGDTHQNLRMYSYIQGNSTGILSASTKNYYGFKNGITIVSFQHVVQSVADAQYTVVLNPGAVNGTGHVSDLVFTMTEFLR